MQLQLERVPIDPQHSVKMKVAVRIQAGDAGSGELFPYIKKNTSLFSFLLPANENEMLLSSTQRSVIPSVPTPSSLFPWLISNHEEVSGLVYYIWPRKCLYSSPPPPASFSKMLSEIYSYGHKFKVNSINLPGYCKKRHLPAGMPPASAGWRSVGGCWMVSSVPFFFSSPPSPPAS